MKSITLCVGPGIGNTVMLLPVVEALKSIEYTVKFLVHPQATSSIDILRGYEYSIGKHANGLVGVPVLWRNCLNADVAREKIVADDLDLNTHHETEVNMTIARKLGYVGKIPEPVLNDVFPVKHESIVIATGCKPEPEWKKKKYPYWRDVCMKLIDLGHSLMFVGLGTERRPWMDKCGENFCGSLPLRESINYIAGAKAVVAIDNGVSHIAAAVGVPTNVLFGPTSIIKNRPNGSIVNVIYKGIDCAPCQRTKKWHFCKSYECMQIDPQYVVDQLVLEKS